jgi:hypothetical protein
MLWEAWSFTRPFRTGRTINDAVDFILSLPESKQLLSSARQDTVDSAAIALHADFARYAEQQGAVMDVAAWLVTARS